MTALVYDDDADVANLLQHRLIRLGLATRAATDRAGFEQALRERTPQVIFLDLALGDTDAVEIISLLSAADFRGRVVLTSGAYTLALDHVSRIGTRVGLDIAGLLKKPYRSRELRALVDGLFQARTPQAAPAPQPETGLSLGEGLANDWIEFWYQPKIDLASGRIVGAEALARLRHPALGVRSAGPLLGTASKDELSELLMRSFDDVVRHAPLLESRNGPLGLSINLSGRSLAEPELLERLKERRTSADRPPRIILEITETDVIEDQHAAQAFATRAVLHGFEISIDDFGIGYATFERLRDMPFTELKLERSMVDGCAADKSLRHICEATVGLARGFGAKVVAEGVEQRADLDVVSALGVDLVQGYLFSRPVPPAEFTALPAAYEVPATRPSSAHRATGLNDRNRRGGPDADG